MTAHKIHFEIFGTDSGVQCQPLRIHKVWLPNHPQHGVYHVVYKVVVKSDVKKRMKIKSALRNRVQWVTAVELEHQRAHTSLRSPELAVFATMAASDQATDLNNIFGTDSGVQCQPLRIHKVWLPNHPQHGVYHVVYKVVVKSDVKKRMKIKSALRNRVQWVTAVELEHQRAHASLRSPELAVFATMAASDQATDLNNIFGTDSGVQCQPLRIHKVWLPNHPQHGVYHVVYKVVVKSDVKKRMKIKSALRNRVQWVTAVELEHQRAHASLRSPELAVFATMAASDQATDLNNEMESGTLVEVCEENVIVGMEGAGAASSPNCLLLQAAGYHKEDQIRLYREFFVLVYPSLYMSPYVFAQFMVDLGWQREQCRSLFRAADVTGRGGLSFVEAMLWAAALEPATAHSGIPAEIRCRYIFRYFDSNRDMKLEYVELKELVAAARASRQLPVDSLSVTREADSCLRQLGLQPNTQLPLADFLRMVGELRLRGTSSLLRAPRSIAGYLLDLQERERDLSQNTPSTSKLPQSQQDAAVTPAKPLVVQPSSAAAGKASSARTQSGALRLVRRDFSMAAYTVRVRHRAPVEMIEIASFDEDAVSSSTARLVTGAVNSTELLGATAAPAEALAAVHFFASCIEKPSLKRTSTIPPLGKAAWSWATPSEEAALGSLLLKLAEAVRSICVNEPRLLRLSSPVYTIGDLHGNLSALLAMESALWPSGPALAPARLLFLGDYVDRGPHGSELLAYLLAAKLQRPTGVLLIRGNHETRDIQKMFTFYNECVSKYGDTEGSKIWNAVNQVFDVLPVAAVVDDKVFCCHGGIPPPWVCPLVSAIDKVPVPLPRPAEQSSIAWELLWNDPVKPNKLTATLSLELAANEGFAANSRRGTGHVFDQSALDRFLHSNQLSHVVRAHEVHQNGFMCQLRGRLISVFSSSRYCGGSNDSGLALLEGGKLRLIRLNDE